MIKTKRVYDPPSPQDGYRILVDKLWPRGVSKEDARVDLWAKELTPSTELRQWYQHDPQKWDVFQQRYLYELTHSAQAQETLRTLKHEHKVITFLYAAKDTEHAHVRVLQSFAEKL